MKGTRLLSRYRQTEAIERHTHREGRRETGKRKDENWVKRETARQIERETKKPLQLQAEGKNTSGVHRMETTKRKAIPRNHL